MKNFKRKLKNPSTRNPSGPGLEFVRNTRSNNILYQWGYETGIRDFTWGGISQTSTAKNKKGWSLKSDNIFSYKYKLNDVFQRNEFNGKLANFNIFEIGYIAFGVDYFKSIKDSETDVILSSLISNLWNSKPRIPLLEDCVEILYLMKNNLALKATKSNLDHELGIGKSYTQFLINTLLKFNYIKTDKFDLENYYLSDSSINMLLAIHNWEFRKQGGPPKKREILKKEDYQLFRNLEQYILHYL